MTAKNFAACFEALLVNEGGYSNDPHDPGGATNLGVIQTEYDAWRSAQGLPRQSVRAITHDEAGRIYRKKYWDVVQADTLPPGVDYVVFDEAVNSGPAQAVRDLQRALGVAVDGHLGEGTLQAVRAAAPQTLINNACDVRLRFLRGLRTWQYFGTGWTRRVAAVRKLALRLASGEVATPTPTTPAKPPTATVPAIATGTAAGAVAWSLTSNPWLVLVGVAVAIAVFYTMPYIVQALRQRKG